LSDDGNTFFLTEVMIISHLERNLTSELWCFRTHIFNLIYFILSFKSNVIKRRIRSVMKEISAPFLKIILFSCGNVEGFHNFSYACKLDISIISICTIKCQSYIQYRTSVFELVSSKIIDYQIWLVRLSTK
jgi:hypothetical protein